MFSVFFAVKSEVREKQTETFMNAFRGLLPGRELGEPVSSLSDSAHGPLLS